MRLVGWWPGEEQGTPAFPGQVERAGRTQRAAGARHVFPRQRTLQNGKRAGDGAGLTAATVAVAVAAVLSLRRGARGRARPRRRRLGGARRRASAGMVGERREVGGGSSGWAPIDVHWAPTAKHMAKRPALLDLTS